MPIDKVEQRRAKAYIAREMLMEAQGRVTMGGTIPRSSHGNGASEGGYLHDELRVSPRLRVEQVHGERRCACGKKLTTYNRTDRCYGCGGGR